jgi:hypothetical protein
MITSAISCSSKTRSVDRHDKTICLYKMHLGNQSIGCHDFGRQTLDRTFFLSSISPHAFLADVGARLSSFGIWSSHLDTIVDWASCMFGLILHHLVVMCVDVRELGTWYPHQGPENRPSLLADRLTLHWLSLPADHGCWPCPPPRRSWTLASPPTDREPRPVDCQIHGDH